jgi:tetratricopeptide (TPR) repeat protein
MMFDAGEVMHLIRQGRHAELEQRARVAIAADPRSGLAWKALSVALAAQGKDALDALTETLRLLPQDAEARSNLALGHFTLGNRQLAAGQPDAAAASYAQCVSLQPGLAAAHCNLANALRQLGRLPEALASVAQAIEIDPGLALAHANQGDLLRELGRSEESAASCRRALALAPGLAGAHNSLGNALLDLGRHAEAAASYRQALDLQPQFPGAEVNLGLALRQLGRGTEAEALCQGLLARVPRSAPALVLLAELASDRGDFAAAEALFRRAADIEPQSAESLAGIAYLRRMTPADGPWAASVQSLAAQAAPRQEIHLRFALGKYHDDVGDHAAAFGHFRRAHELQAAQGRPLDRQRLTQHVDELCAVQSAAWLQRMRAAGTGAPQPVFVLGMPRSGTSLAEQILASHPQVFGAGELAWWGAHAGDAATADGAGLAALGAHYRAQLAALCGGARSTIDKMPANFWHIGLIVAALPDARIIHLRRDPIDTCLSVYTTHFRNAYGYAHDLGDLAHYYREYQRLMRHWRAVLPPGVMLDVPYEGLVEDTPGWSRRMVHFIGLSWDARCLEFQRADRRVLTSSKWQVRQQVHRGSVGRWRPYEPFLGPLLGLKADPA